MYSNNPPQALRQAPNIRRELVKISNDLSRLLDGLTYSNVRITERETMRRRQIVEQLVTKKNNLASSFEAASTNSNNQARNELIGSSSGKRAWGKDTEQTQGMSNQQIFDQNNQAMNDQDVALDLLSGSLMKQKVLATTMNTEITKQNLMLDDIEVGVDRTTTNLSQTTSTMDTLRRNASSCGLIMCIVLLIIVIIVLLATDSGCKIYNDPKHC
ncbi:hypothetical protein SAMD00019534_092500 [Acytostelium subglobosum LB1]|uniref:hypothetical protein n=1 Tax=Acytostelium subglobosum LB1 TaxID=1410327 RepID=UPI000644FDE4|nr:hypothetical protein SAMD00019534_092500 [Acytostelium subglobosum LB1]GAM26075.1 hypothetical protein SAMD00019534_092500 [Acytostelium subglobosum LB1]|eukprot:XP_012751118.1 hypothetical protein SAMD00019534_092500 [Acytostelium subglobosum LB1]